MMCSGVCHKSQPIFISPCYYRGDRKISDFLWKSGNFPRGSGERRVDEVQTKYTVEGQTRADSCTVEWRTAGNGIIKSCFGSPTSSSADPLSFSVPSPITYGGTVPGTVPVLYSTGRYHGSYVQFSTVYCSTVIWIIPTGTSRYCNCKISVQ